MYRRSEIPQPVSPTRSRGGGIGGPPGSPARSRGNGSPGSPARSRPVGPPGSPSRGRGLTPGAVRGRGASHSVSPTRGRGPAAVTNTAAVATGMRYITDDLIRKIGKENDLNMITSLNLTLTKGQGKKIRYIENLNGLRRLEILSLSCNVIEKIEKLDKLTRLQELDLSYNAIAKIEGLETLTMLRSLNLSGNKIEHIPPWVPKKLRSLQVFKIAKNNIQSLSEITRLRPLKDLTQLAAAQNPVAQLSHYRLYLVFHLHTLGTLDNQPISIQERQAAQSRFQQEELDALQHMVAEKEAEIQQLRESHDRSLSELQERNAFTHAQQAQLQQHTELVHQLELELGTKNDLLKKKTSELTKACEKHYELEQELAFYKIDHKFETLGKLPSPESESGPDDGEGLIGESPYIGKGRFQKMQQERRRKAQMARQVSADTASSMDSETRERMHQMLDLELEEKRNAIEKAQERLIHLQDDLQSTQNQLTSATQELESLKDVPGNRPLTEDDKQQMQGTLGKKIGKVQNLRKDTQKLEKELKRAQHDIQEQERGIGQLQGKLRRVASKDSLYDAMTREMHDQEGALAFSHQMYDQMQKQLHKMLATIAKEAADIKKLEQELRDGQVAQNNEIKAELEGIIGGLQTYLADVQQRAKSERGEYDALLREREELVQRMNEIEIENKQLAIKEDEIQLLQKQLEDLEASLEEQRENNKSLRYQLDETRQHEAEDEMASHRLQDAENELAHLKQLLRDAELRAQAEAEQYRRQLEEERRKSENVAQRAREARNLQGDLDELHNQLMELQNANTNLQDQLYSEKQKQKEQKSDAVDPDDLKERLNKVVRSLRTGKPWEREVDHIDPEEADHIGQVLNDLQNQVQQELDRSFHELERARDAKAKAENEAVALREAYAEAFEQERERAERAAQAQLENEQREMERLKHELDQLRSELERERRSVRHPSLPPRLLEPSTHSDGITGTTPRSSSEEETSSIPSSQWSSRRRNLYDSMTHDEQDLFDELQKEIEELRKLLGMRDKDAAQKARDAERKASQLRQMISGRRKRESERDSDPPGYPSQMAKGAAHRLREAADDLMRAQEEIESLHRQLREKDKLLHRKHPREERNEHTIAAQQDEIDRLTSVLEEQRTEIGKLADQLDALKRQNPEQSLSYEDDVQQLRRGAADLRSNIAAHGPRIHRLSGTDYYPAEGRRASEHHEPRHRDDRRIRDEPDMYRGDVRERDRFPSHARGPHARVEHTPERRMRSDYRGSHRSPERRDIYEERPRHPADMYDEYGAPLHRRDYPDAAHESGYVPRDQFDYAEGHPQPYMHPHSEPVHRYPGAAASQPLSGPGFGPPPAPQMAPPPVYGPSPAFAPPVIRPIVPTHLTGPVLPAASAAGVPVAAPPTGVPLSMPPGGGGGPVYALATETPAMMTPVTPPTLRMAPVHNPVNQSFLVSAQTTPIAGNGYNAPVQQIGGAVVQPVMVSTPISSPSRGHIKGILKNPAAAAADEELVCTVPQHHDLEDYVAKLQAKVKSLKSKLKQQANKSLEEEESRHVLFEEDVDRDAIRRLKAELEDRRAELEGLDLAIERQKASLKHMKASERVLLAEKTAMKEELENLRNDPTARADRRHKFLHGNLDIEVTDDDYDYEFPARSHMSRRDFLTAELDCLEGTLAKRRAELREADALLVECEEDLHDAQQQALKMLSNYEHGKYGSRQATSEVSDLEHRAEIAQEDLMSADKQLHQMKEEMLELKELREAQEQMLADIQKVIAAKDLEFQEMDAKVKLKSGSLSSLEHAESETQLKVVQESGRLSDYRPEITNLQKQLAEGKVELEELDHEIGRNKAELALLEDTIQKRRLQLDSLDSEVDQEILAKRKKLKEVEEQLDTLREKEKQVEAEVKVKAEQLKQVQDSLNHEETVLQNLSELTQKQRAGLQQLTREHAETQNDMTSLQSQLVLAKSQLEQTNSKQREDEREMKRIENEKLQRTRDLEHLSQSIDRTRNDFETLREQQRALEGSTESLRKEKASLEDTQKLLEKKITHSKRNQVSTEEALRAVQTKLSRAEQDARELESEVEERQREKADLAQECRTLRNTLQDGRHELEKLQTDIESAEGHVNRLQQLHNSKTADLDDVVKELGIKRVELHHVHARHDVLKREVERRQINEDKMSKLEREVKELGHELGDRTSEKEHLVAALAKSCDELQDSRAMNSQEKDMLNSQIRELQQTVESFKVEREDRLKEIGDLRDKCSRDIADLEGIAQAHYSRANRLNDELNYLRGEFLFVKRQLSSQEELAEREKQLQETLMQLKSEIKAEVSISRQDLEKSRDDAENELDQLHNQKGDIEQHLGSLKHSLNLIRTGETGLSTKPAEKISVSDQFALQQDLLKRQLKQKLALQAEVVEAQRQLSQDKLRQLQAKLATMEQTYSPAESIKFTPLSDFTTSKVTLSDLEHSADHGKGAELTDLTVSQPSQGDETRRKRAYSPHRHSQVRLGRCTSTDSLVPEKGPSE